MPLIFAKPTSKEDPKPEVIKPAVAVAEAEKAKAPKNIDKEKAKKMADAFKGTI